ncbi:thioredoxin domain-containing protein [Terrilactibacillus sp. S3-3]|nr:thioredoxin domain-containing protein [Terrilactibacillus sp. S3-3]
MSENNQHQSQVEKDRKKAKRRQIVVISTVLVVVLIAAIVVAIVFKNQQGSRQQAANKATHKTEKAVHIQYDGHPVTGRSDAPVKIAEFADYRCPYCKQFEEKIVPKLKKDYIESGKASFYFMNNTILGQGSVIAANAADEVYHQNPKAFWNPSMKNCTKSKGMRINNG